MRAFNYALFTWFLILVPCIFLVAGQPSKKNDVRNKIGEKNTTKITTNRGVELSVALPAKTVVGNGIGVVLSVTNKGKEGVRFLIGHYRELNLIVLDTEATAVGLTRYGQRVIGDNGPTVGGRRVTKFLSPGESYSETFNLARLFDLSISGDYKLSLKRDVVEYSKSRPLITLEIKDISFKVVEPEK